MEENRVLIGMMWWEASMIENPCFLNNTFLKQKITPTTDASTAPVDYVATVRQWGLDADIVQLEKDMYKMPGFDMSQTQVFLRSVCLWELICQKEAPKTVWRGAKPEPWPHNDAERDGICPGVKTATGEDATATAAPVDYVALVRDWNHEDLFELKVKIYNSEKDVEESLAEFWKTVRLWELICRTEAPKDLRTGMKGNPEPWPHKESERDGKCPKVTTTTCKDYHYHHLVLLSKMAKNNYHDNNNNYYNPHYDHHDDDAYHHHHYDNHNPDHNDDDDHYHNHYVHDNNELEERDTKREPFSAPIPTTTGIDYVAMVRKWSRADISTMDESFYAKETFTLDELREFRKSVHLWELVCQAEAPKEIWELWKEEKPDPWPHSDDQRDGNCPNVEQTTVSSVISTLSTLGFIPTTDAPNQCINCNEFAKCEEESSPGVCEKCACPLGRRGSCCEEIVDLCAEKETNPCAADTPDMQRTCKVVMPAGNTKCECTPGWIGRNCTEKFDPCEHHKCVNGGKCVDDGVGGYHCDCTWEFKGEYCEMPEPCYPRCQPCTSMAWRCENNSTCWPGLTQQDHDFQCICRKGYKGKYCGEAIPCEAFNPCKNGGDCYREEGRVVCECLSIWTGEFCETFNICHDDKCVNGICNPVNETHFTCSCWRGFTGENCEIRIDLCDTEMPCRHNGSCISKIADYECFCLPGTSGKNCEHNFDDCVDPTTGITNRYEFTCECSEDWTGATCTIRMMIYEVIKHFKNADESLVGMLEDLLETPELIKEALPFFLALMPPENQTEISWDHEDVFEWATYENSELNLNKDIVKWNAATLGNCFTFNHDSQPEKMPLRYAGEQEGFRALMRVRQDEYLDWIDTASLLVFVHSSTESVFGESVRFQAKPGAETTLMTSLNSFERLGGRFGECVVEKSEVTSYYYDGNYVTDGCLRSCYQDAVYDECKCMDPRYPRKDGVPACDLSQRSCVLKVTDQRGDPSTWPQCRCPLPCMNAQYNVRWSQKSLSPRECNKFKTGNQTGCQSDQVLISVYLPHIIQNTFKEEAKIDVSDDDLWHLGLE
ncbi:hypothetical protein QR680_008669 [Steinernema hermaphroditum]|uniref:EGF-like domain-containing protein n=1 Tax=Steinernema hermaphroditum TaxID=289476 RepID=A0AA39IJQ8_9BILA|nr:hypothetical protein QR680_008669 [Steinernema hermaphroditum]